MQNLVFPMCKIGIIFALLTLFIEAWTYPQAKNHWEDYPIKYVYVDPEDLGDAKPYPGSRILKGHEVSPHEIPYQAWIVFRMSPGGNGWSCGGSLITKRFILTAAHCMLWAGLAEVYLGAHNITEEESNRIIITSTTLISHPDYNPTNITNDVGVIDLEQELELDEYINVVKLPRLTDLNKLYEGDNVRVSGWGLTVAKGNSSNTLLAINSTVLPNADCKAVFNIFEDSEICISGSDGVGVCSGDSGGPLVVGDNIQIGIVSYATRDCVYGYPSVFTKVTSFLDWIQDNSDYVIQD